MKINPYNIYKSVQQNNKTAPKTSAQDSIAENHKQSDKVTFTEHAKIFSDALQRAKETQEIRSDKVRSIQAQIRNGTYIIESTKVAEKILRGIFA